MLVLFYEVKMWFLNVSCNKKKAEITEIKGEYK